ncbi:MAG: serine hydrolase [Myxococcota bacterium]|nr:serine hydrolase [Myxococcota bacterium]
MARRLAAVCAILAALPALVAAEAGESAVPDLSPEQVPIAEELQTFLTAAIEERLASDEALREQALHVALYDLPVDGAYTRAHWRGDVPVYPASVVKFVYLMAAYAWRDQGLLTIDPAFDRQLEAMIRVSSNKATQVVLRRLTETVEGPELGDEDYAAFRERRHRVKRWLETLGVDDLHTVHPTYDGGGDIHGRDLQFLQDKTVEGALPGQKGPYWNRQAMTADDTAQLLALLALDRALSPATSAEVRERMRRDPVKQPKLKKKIAGGTRGLGVEVFSKGGTWGPIWADAGIVRHASGHQLVLVVFLRGRPAYRGTFIADLAGRVVERVLPVAAKAD